MRFGQFTLFDVFPNGAHIRRADDAHDLLGVEMLVVLERRELSRGVLTEAHACILKRLTARF